MNYLFIGTIALCFIAPFGMLCSVFYFGTYRYRGSVVKWFNDLVNNDGYWTRRNKYNNSEVTNGWV